MNRLSEDRGSLLLLGIGWIVICLFALAVMTDVTAAFLQRPQLMAVPDAAALAGDQTVDLDAYNAQGAQIRTRLSPAQVAAAMPWRLGTSLGCRWTRSSPMG